jgi:hypothetical protein
VSVAIDSTGTGHHFENTTCASTGSVSFSFTNTAGTLLIVGVIVTCGAGGTVYSQNAITTSVTYNGVSLTKITGAAQAWAPDASSFNQNEASLWYLTNPATGANTVVVNCQYADCANVTFDQDVIAGAQSYTGAASFGTPVGAKVDTGGGSTSPSVTVSSTTTGNLVVAMMGTGTGYTSTSNTIAWSLNVSTLTAGDNAAMTTQAPSGSSTTMTDTVSQDWWGIVAVELQAAAAAAKEPLFEKQHIDPWRLARWWAIFR